ncbi:MAG: hypothetical protein NC341_02030 [Blautia sp.]|nr:hypothetical protein [Blautia sp.]MCM1200396.1 hypothetical protein [Bacteroides fragilis]
MDSQNNDFKYYMQDAGRLYFGARYSYAELLAHEMVPFKFKSIIEHYIMKDTRPDTTLESQFYYMTPEMFSCKTYGQLKAKVKVSLLVEKKTLFGKSRMVYRDQLFSLDEFVRMNLAQKKKHGVKIQEILLSKLALMSFSV